MHLILFKVRCGLLKNHCACWPASKVFKFYIFIFQRIKTMHTPSGLLQTTVQLGLKVTRHNLIFRYIEKCIFFIKYFVCYCKATVHFDHKQRHKNFIF